MRGGLLWKCRQNEGHQDGNIEIPERVISDNQHRIETKTERWGNDFIDPYKNWNHETEDCNIISIT